MLVTALAVDTFFGLPRITATIAVVFPSDGLLFLGVLLVTSISLLFVDGVTFSSSSSLGDVRQLSVLSLSMIVGVALIGLGEVNYCFL